MPVAVVPTLEAPVAVQSTLEALEEHPMVVLVGEPIHSKHLHPGARLFALSADEDDEKEDDKLLFIAHRKRDL